MTIRDLFIIHKTVSWEINYWICNSFTNFLVVSKRHEKSFLHHQLYCYYSCSTKTVVLLAANNQIVLSEQCLNIASFWIPADHEVKENDRTLLKMVTVTAVGQTTMMRWRTLTWSWGFIKAGASCIIWFTTAVRSLGSDLALGHSVYVTRVHTASRRGFSSSTWFPPLYMSPHSAKYL